MLRFNERAATRASGGLRVLVADDNPVNLMLAADMLKLLGIEPLLAGDGAEAVALAAETPLDLILMDIQMPLLDGLAATKQIRKIEQDRAHTRVPVVAYTTSRFKAGVLESCGLDGMLEKPCDIGQLRECLQRWCLPQEDARTRGKPVAASRPFNRSAGHAPRVSER